MTERPYLSIGEVLGLLLEEFPDVTISKIRFLEAQGLIDPERTSSGYRKFYDLDVERLRFILKEQKDNYLPLKVIKDRLDSIDYTLPNPPRPIPSGASWLTAPGDDESVVTSPARPAEPDPGSDVREPISTSVVFAELRRADAARRDDTAATARSTPSEWVRSDSSSSAGIPRPAPADLVAAADHEPGEQGEPPADPIAIARSVEAHPANDPSDAIERRQIAVPTPLEQQTAPAEVRQLADVVEQTRPSEPVPVHVPPVAEVVVPRPDPAARVDPGLSSAGELHVELTADELCQRAAIAPALLKDLESYGLLSSRLVSGLPIYGLDAVRVATAAGQLSVHGLEPRHLRAWRTSVDREVALIEQIVQPLVRQRNPQSRAQANQRANEIMRLGGDLRNALIRTAIQALIEP